MSTVRPSSTIEDRLQALEDKDGILRTMYQYGHAMDGRSLEQFLDCFTEDGVWVTTIAGKFAGTGGIRLEGRTQLTDWFSSLKPTLPGNLRKHMIVAPDLRIDGDRATAQTYFCVIHETENGPIVFSFGQYLDVLRRSKDGRWRFSERHLARDGVDKSAQGKAVGHASVTAGDRAPGG